MDTQQQKRAAAVAAVAHVRSGTIVGLGHGSTAAFAVRRIAERLEEGSLTNILGVACSMAVEESAVRLGIPITSLDEHPEIDLTIDGADEVDPALRLIKGGGGALLREKIVARASKREIIVVDAGKLSPALGIRFALPVEVLPLASRTETRYLASLGAAVSRRGGDNPVMTDQGNYILDCRFGPLDDPEALSRLLDARPGIMAHGLFIDLATDLIVGDPRGVHHITRGDDPSGLFAAVDDSQA